MRYLLTVATLALLAQASMRAQTPDRQAALAGIDSRAKHYGDVALQIWGFAEVGYQEQKSSAMLQEQLKAAGFTVKAGVAEIPTAFTAEWGSGKPVIAIIGPVIVDDMTLFSVRGIQAFPAEQRARAIADRIKRVAADRSIPTASLTVAEAEHSKDIMAGDEKVVSIFDADAALDRIPRPVLAGAYLARIKSSIEKYRQDRSPKNLARGAGYSLLGRSVLSLPSS